MPQSVSCELLLYADDFENMESNLDPDLNSLFDWVVGNKLSSHIGEDKTKSYLSGNLTVSISDHLPQIITVPKENTKVTKKENKLNFGMWRYEIWSSLRICPWSTLFCTPVRKVLKI